MVEGLVNLFTGLASVLGETGTRLGMTMSSVASNSQLSTEDGEPLTSVSIFWGATMAPLVASTGEILANINVVLGRLWDAFWS